MALRRERGQRANWNPEAKMRAYLVAESTVKFTGAEFTRKGKLARWPRSPYRDVYDEAKAKAQVALHRRDCPRCGVCGVCGNLLALNKKEHLKRYGCAERSKVDAPAGSPLSASHAHARATRAVAKNVLKDLWEEARHYHEGD